MILDKLDELFNQRKQKQLRYKKGFKDTKLLADLAQFTGFYGDAYVPGDPYTSAYNEGKRRVFLHILSILDQSDDEIRKILNQNKQELLNQL